MLSSDLWRREPLCLPALGLPPDEVVGGRICLEHALQSVFERANGAASFADMMDRELDMRAEVADREFIARDDIALELRRDGQGGAFRREQRIVGAVGAQIGRASCRERVCQSVSISVVADS